MGQLDYLQYEAKIYALENGRYNWYVYACPPKSQNQRIGGGAADSEIEAIKLAQEKATEDRLKREQEKMATKTVILK